MYCNSWEEIFSPGTIWRFPILWIEIKVGKGICQQKLSSKLWFPQKPLTVEWVGISISPGRYFYISTWVFPYLQVGIYISSGRYFHFARLFFPFEYVQACEFTIISPHPEIPKNCSLRKSYLEHLPTSKVFKSQRYDLEIPPGYITMENEIHTCSGRYFHL